MLARVEAAEGRMSEARQQDFGLEAFLAWEADQPQRWELIDGRPRLMTGGTQAHWLIAGNIVAALRPRLRGSPCRAGGSDLRVVTGNGNVRYPDAMIDCGALRPDSPDVSEPAVVFEVLSRSTALIDLHAKLRDYDATPGIRLYVVVAQDTPWVAVWTRDPSGRLAVAAALSESDAALKLDPVPAALPLAEIYEGLSFPAPAAA